MHQQHLQASSTELGRLFQVLTTRAEKNMFVNHNETTDYAIYNDDDYLRRVSHFHFYENLVAANLGMRFAL